MVSMNRVILAGNLTRDPELKETSAGSMASFSIAVSKKWKDNAGKLQQQTSFFKIVVWNSNAINCSKYLKKGKPVLVEGRLEKHSFKNDAGETQYVTQIIGNNVTFLSKPTDTNLSTDSAPAIL